MRGKGEYRPNSPYFLTPISYPKSSKSPKFKWRESELERMQDNRGTLVRVERLGAKERAGKVREWERAKDGEVGGRHKGSSLAW